MHQDLAKVKYMTRVAMVMVRTYQKLMVAMANIVRREPYDDRVAMHQDLAKVKYTHQNGYGNRHLGKAGNKPGHPMHHVVQTHSFHHLYKIHGIDIKQGK